MNKKQFIERMVEHTDSPKGQATKHLEAFTTTITEALEAGEEVQLPGFGKFYDLGGGDRASAVHHRRPGASLLRRRPYRHRSLRSDTGEIRDQRAQRTPLSSVHPLFTNLVEGRFFRTSPVWPSRKFALLAP